jgi:hypothetical protein
MSLVIALVLAGTWAVSASASSLPGQALYPVKLAAERARLAVTVRHGARAHLHLVFAERRLGEVQRLLGEEGAVAQSLVDALVAETEMALDELEEVGAAKKAAVGAKLLALTEQQQAVLTQVKARAPEAAQAGLSRALEASRRGHERAMMVLGTTPEPSPAPKATRTPKPSRTLRAKPTHKPTHTPRPSHTPRPKATRTPKPSHPTHKPTHTPRPSHTPRPTSHVRPTPKPTHTPRPSHTPRAKPTHAPQPDEPGKQGGK